MADMRERLIELIVDCENELVKAHPYTTDTFRIGAIADHLIENGVIALDADSITIPTKRECIETFANMPIDEVLQLVQAKQEGKLLVLPCKVGDIVYVVRSATSNGKNLYLFEDRVERIVTEKSTDCNAIWTRLEFYEHMSVFEWEFSNVFLTKEEAEQALKERE